ncbi:unnamed protein product [Staurois parvus]|uniref:Uncharacterized protein n=1 Tax=Staurois parvus TaxID=386267 RepID=A0ABN9G081_9NEOB|nr:unnamed protein product [Staurois parvus]
MPPIAGVNHRVPAGHYLPGPGDYRQTVPQSTAALFTMQLCSLSAPKHAVPESGF